MTVSRNDPCPCGSGQRYKRCCGKIADESALVSAAAISIDDEQATLVGLFHEGRYAELEQRAQALLTRHPGIGFVWKLYGVALGVQGKDALFALQRAVVLLPGDVDVHNNLGNALKDLGRVEAAVVSYRRAIALKPDFASAHYNLGISLRALGQLDGALACYRRALAARPDYAEAHSNLGKSLLDSGRLGEAMDSLRHALKLDPKCIDANRAYLTALLYQPDMTTDALFKEHIACAMRVAEVVAIPFDYPNPRTLRRKLRVGYVSSDFRDHPVGRNLRPLIECHDRNAFEIYLYGHVKRPDAVTDWFKNTAYAWRSILDLSDKSVAEMIRRDQIDILVLLAGRFDDNRPLIAAHRAAPVQVSFHDPATSGLREMDYLITDKALSPRSSSEGFTERLVRLPTYYVHPPVTQAPEVSKLPAQQHGHVTFGSFNNPSKVNDRVVALWGRVLHAVPGSRLVLKYQNLFGNERVRQHYLDLFSSQGIESHRLDLVSAADPSVQHMARYASIDIALDTFPFSGSTTTFEALWMGVPVVTLLGDHMVARWSGAMLKKLKLEELIAHSEDEYVKIAQGLAQDIDRLAALRAGLRGRVSKSPLCDEKGRARQIERAYRWMWAKWCAEQAAK